MRSKIAKLLLALALGASSPARAQHATGTYLAFTPATSGGGCVASSTQVCQWYDSVSGQLQLRTVSGDTQIGGPVAAYKVIEQQFTPLVGRPALNFISGMVCLDNPGSGGSTDCTVQHGVLLVAGTPQTQRSYLNFASGVTCVDNAGADRTDCTVSGGGGGGTLQNAYDAGGAGGGIIVTSNSGGGLISRLSAGVWVAGHPVLGAQDSTGTAHMFEVSPTGVGIGVAAPAALGVNVPYVKISATTSGNTDLVIFSDANSSGDGTQVLTENRLAPLNLKRLGWSVANDGTIFFDRYNDNGTAASGFDLIAVDPSSNIQITSGSNLGVLSHLLLDASTARLVAQNAVVNASNASGTLLTYTPWTIGIEYISDGIDFYNQSFGDILILDNTGAVTTFVLAPGLTGANNVQLGKPLRPFSALYVPIIHGGDPASGLAAIAMASGEMDLYANEGSGTPVAFLVAGEVGPYTNHGVALGDVAHIWTNGYFDALILGGTAITSITNPVKLDPAVWSSQHNNTSFSGNNTVGIYFYSNSTPTVTGVKLYWCGPARTIKVSLWDVGTTTRVATGSAAVGGSGLVTINFGTPFTLIAGTIYAATYYDTSTNNYCATTNGSGDFNNLWPGAAVGTVTDNVEIYYTGNGAGAVSGRFGSGDAFPSTSGSNVVYGATPIYTP